MLRAAFVALVLVAQDPDLIEQLGDPDVAVRDRATAALAAKGEAARPELLQARKHRDPEIRGRAYDLLCRIDGDLALQRLVKSQRARKITLFAGGDNENGANTAVTDGARFWFSRRPWAPKGEVLGTILETVEESYLQGSISWTVAAVKADAALPVETCAYHSPRLVYVPGVPPERVTVVLKGTRHWACEVPVEFNEPAERDQKRVGAYTLTLRWPDVVVASGRPVLQSLLNAAVEPKEVEKRYRPGREPNRFGGRMTFTTRTGCGLAGNLDVAWCGCLGKPAAGTPPAPEVGQEARINLQVVGGVDDLEWLRFPFHMPVEEPFELRSPALK